MILMLLMMNKHLAESPVVPLQPANCTVTIPRLSQHPLANYINTFARLSDQSWGSDHLNCPLANRFQPDQQHHEHFLHTMEALAELI